MNAPPTAPGARATLDEVRRRIDALPPLRAVTEEAGLSPKKSLGQHFLFDLNLTDKIARAARLPGASPRAPLAGRLVVEIGPGPGGLTRSLLKAGARVLAVERDARAVDALAPLAEAAEGRLTVHQGDALAFDAAARAEPGAIICANLPYNVATPLLVGWLTAAPWPPWWAGATVMVQREVAARMVAQPGTADYGRLAVLVGTRAVAARMFDVPPSAFVPPPKVWSSVVRLDPRPDGAAVDIAALSAVSAAAFGQRRKMLRSSLRSLPVDVEALLSSAEIRAEERAERLTLADFHRLAALYAAARAGGSAPHATP